MISLLFAFWIFFFSSLQSEEKGKLEIRITNAKSDQGKIRVLIFSSESGFPDQPQKALRSISLDPKNKGCELAFSNLPHGKYAISVIHDENNDGKMTTNFFGYPNERFGFSNNPKIYLGPPTFEKATFELRSENQQIQIDLH